MLGILLFIVLYMLAALNYPGGSQFDQHSQSFSWTHNYWCTLLNDQAINGEHNPAKPIAIAAMLVLSISLGFFWWLFPRYTETRKFYKIFIPISGILSMVFGLLLFSPIDHDLITNLASLFGVLAMMASFIVLYKMNWKQLFYFGLLNILLILANNYLYYSTDLIYYLPVVQKITFAVILIWFCCVDLRIYREAEKLSC
jgi:hypothetical protein